jgi:hypothetical protein
LLCGNGIVQSTAKRVATKQHHQNCSAVLQILARQNEAESSLSCRVVFFLRRKSVSVTAASIEKFAYMIIGLTMQHPSGAALPPLDRMEKPVQLNIIEQGKESSTPDVSRPYQPQEQANHAGQHQLINPVMHRFMDDHVSTQLHQPQMMGQLETQFGQFSLQNQGQQGNSDQFDSSEHNSISDNNNIEDIEGEEGDEEPVKLFVGQVRLKRVWDLLSHFAEWTFDAKLYLFSILLRCSQAYFSDYCPGSEVFKRRGHISYVRYIRASKGCFHY